MSFSELLLTLLVALMVFGPNKLPMLAQHLGQLLHQYNRFKEKVHLFWQVQLSEQQLQENIKKAQRADEMYLTEKKDTH